MLKRKIIKTITSLVLSVSVIASMSSCHSGVEEEKTAGAGLEENITINLWYTSSLYTSYFEECAARYHDENPNVTVELKRVGDEDYLDNIYDECVRTDNCVDVFMMPSDDVQKAYLMGLMRPNASYPDIYNEQIYGRNAMAACTYGDKLAGYPLTFEASVMVYNKKYGKEYKTFKELTSFHDDFQFTDETEGVTIIGWDVSDISLNYAFAGAYMSVGGDNADEVSKTSLQDDKIKQAISSFVGFKDAYGIIRNNVKYSDYLEKFKSGSLLYTIVKTNDLAAINGSEVDYGIIPIPDFDESLKTKAAARTFMLAVTPYSKNHKTAESVAKAFTYDYAGSLNEKASMPASRTDLEDQPAEYKRLLSIYSDMALKARYIEIGDYYVNMEIMLHKSWDGSSTIDEAYDTFKNYVMAAKQPKSSAAQ